MSTELVILEGADEPTQRLCREYWLVGPKRRFVFSLSELAARHDTAKEAILQRVRASCVLFEREGSCVACAAPNAYRHRAEFQQRRAIDRAWVCPSCLAETAGHTHVPSSHDPACVSFLRAELAARRGARRSLEALAPSIAVFLAAVVRASRLEPHALVQPVRGWVRPLSPTPELDRTLLNALLAEGCLAIAPLSAARAVSLLQGELRYDSERVHWLVPWLDEARDGRALLRELEALSADQAWCERASNELERLGQRVALEESLHALRLAFDDANLGLPAVESLEPELADALRNLTVGQLRRVIGEATEHAARALKAGSHRREAMSTVVAHEIRRRTERALARGLVLEEAPGDVRAPTSHLNDALDVFRQRSQASQGLAAPATQSTTASAHDVVMRRPARRSELREPGRPPSQAQVPGTAVAQAHVCLAPLSELMRVTRELHAAAQRTRKQSALRCAQVEATMQSVGKALAEAQRLAEARARLRGVA